MTAILESPFDRYVRENVSCDMRCVARDDGLYFFADVPVVRQNQYEPHFHPHVQPAIAFVRIDAGRLGSIQKMLESGEPVDGSLVDSRLCGGFYVDSIGFRIERGKEIGDFIAKLVSHGEVSVEVTVR